MHTVAFRPFQRLRKALEKPQEDEESSGAASSTAQPVQELGATRALLIARCAVFKDEDCQRVYSIVYFYK